ADLWPPVSLDAVIDKACNAFLCVTSQAPATAVKGGVYTYPLEVKSKKGGVKYKLESGPPGMRIGPDGRVTWAVPADFAGADADVIVTVSDATGQEVVHTFRITIKEK